MFPVSNSPSGRPLDVPEHEAESPKKPKHSHPLKNIGNAYRIAREKTHSQNFSWPPLKVIPVNPQRYDTPEDILEESSIEEVPKRRFVYNLTKTLAQTAERVVFDRLQKALEKAQKQLSAIHGEIENDRLFKYWQKNPGTFASFEALDRYNDKNGTEIEPWEFTIKKKQLENYRHDQNGIRDAFCRTLMTIIGRQDPKSFEILSTILGADRFLSLDYVPYVKKLAKRSTTQEEFASITHEMLKQVTRYMYVNDLDS